MSPQVNISEVFKIASAFSLGFAKERFKRLLLIQSVSAGNVTQAKFCSTATGLASLL